MVFNWTTRETIALPGDGAVTANIVYTPTPSGSRIYDIKHAAPKGMKCCYIDCPGDTKWHTLPLEGGNDRVLLGACIVMLDNKTILACGGYSQTKIPPNIINFVETSSCISIDLDARVVNAFPAMLKARSHAAGVVYHGDIIVIGGTTDTSDPTNSCEQFDTAQGKWKLIASINNTGPVSAAVSADRVYAFCSGKSIEVYDGVVWNVLDIDMAMWGGFRCAEAAAVGGQIVCCGWCSDDPSRCMLYFFDPDTGKIDVPDVPVEGFISYIASFM